jgi:hypothetical protein
MQSHKLIEDDFKGRKPQLNIAGKKLLDKNYNLTLSDSDQNIIIL